MIKIGEYIQIAMGLELSAKTYEFVTYFEKCLSTWRIL